MINYAIRFKSSAKKELADLDRKLIGRVLTAIDNFATGKPCDAKKCKEWNIIIAFVSMIIEY